MPIMAKRHGKKRSKEEEKTPAQQRIGVEEAIHRLYNLNAAILCHTCDKTDCVNRFQCQEYKTTKEQFVKDVKAIEKSEEPK